MFFALLTNFHMISNPVLRCCLRAWLRYTYICPPSFDALNATSCDVVVRTTPAPKTSQQQLHEEDMKYIEINYVPWDVNWQACYLATSSEGNIHQQTTGVISLREMMNSRNKTWERSWLTNESFHQTHWGLYTWQPLCLMKGWYVNEWTSAPWWKLTPGTVLTLHLLMSSHSLPETRVFLRSSSASFTAFTQPKLCHPTSVRNMNCAIIGLRSNTHMQNTHSNHLPNHSKETQTHKSSSSKVYHTASGNTFFELESIKLHNCNFE